ncbi:MAG: peptidoglycan DD-metalloendopeptidase family protein [Bacteroidaceae bacterium]|nr:peptidoglycan DD-metalloendopeptidase family protein [Bacteroidaceae bacterium]
MQLTVHSFHSPHFPSLTGGARGGSVRGRSVWCGSLLFLLFFSLSLSAQNSKKVQALKAQKTELQKILDKSKAKLNVTRQKVQTGQRDLHFIGVQMDNRLDYIRRLEGEMNLLDDQIVQLQVEITTVDGELQAKREKLRQALRYARHQKAQQSALLFVLSAKTLTQMYRRARMARQYAAYQQQLGKQIMQKQADLLDAQNRLLEAKSQQTELLREVIGQRRQLSAQQVEQRKKVDGLKKEETGLQGQVAQQQKQLAALDKKIDELIAYEIEQARKRAEEAARKKAAAEAAKKAQAAKAAKGSKGSKGSKVQEAKGSTGSTNAKSGQTQEKNASGNWLTAEDRQLSGSFEKNKGRLPVPITGPYMLGNRFGLYTVPGLKNVQLDNKGTNYIGRSGARARSIYDGEVTAVFQFSGTRNVLVRHGSYISVYCNLSSVIVKKGQKVKARDVLGTVAQDEKGNCVLHFQLRKETAKLNPEAWIGK